MINPVDTPIAFATFAITLIISLTALLKVEKLYALFIFKPWTFFKEKKYYTLITSGLIHADFGHLILNMLTFFFFAFTLEAIVGPMHFFYIYFGSMVLCEIPTLFKQRNNQDFAALGASGAIAGVLFSYIIFDPHSKIYLFFIPIGIPSPIFALLFLLFSYFSSKRSSTRIHHEGHLWGALSGVFITFILYPQILIHKINAFIK